MDLGAAILIGLLSFAGILRDVALPMSSGMSKRGALSLVLHRVSIAVVALTAVTCVYMLLIRLGVMVPSAAYRRVHDLKYTPPESLLLILLLCVGAGSFYKKSASDRFYCLIAMTVLVVTLTAVTGYLLGGTVLYNPIPTRAVGAGKGVSLGTSLSLMTLALAGLAAHCAREPKSLLVSPRVAGVIARQFLLTLIASPVLIGVGAYLAWRWGFVTGNVANSLAIVAVVVALSLMIWITANKLEVADIAREEAERQVIESENQLHLLMENLPVGVWFVGPTGSLLRSNPVGREVLKGLTNGEDYDCQVTSSDCGSGRIAAPVGIETSVKDVVVDNEVNDGVVGGVYRSCESPSSVLPSRPYDRYKSWWPNSGCPVEFKDWPVMRVIRDGRDVKDEVIEIQDIGGKRKYVSSSAIRLEDKKRGVYGALAVYVDVTNRYRLEREHAFIAGVSKELLQPMSLRTAFQKVVDLSVPFLADACLLAFRGADGQVEWVADNIPPGIEGDLIRKATETHRPDMKSPFGVHQVFTAGVSVLVPEVNEEILRSFSQSEEDFESLRWSIGNSYVLVPVRSTREVIGALVLIFANSGRRHDEAYIPVAEEVGRVAGLAIENVISQQKLEAAIMARDDVLAVISHDLRNPLGVILSGARLVDEMLDDPSVNVKAIREVIGVTKSASERMLHLVRDLLDISQMEAGRMRLDWSRSNARELATSAIELFGAQAMDKQIALATCVPEDLPDVLCDKGRVFQVISNLLGNALKHTPAGGRVCIRARFIDSDWVEFSVEDTGPGISPEFIPYIFDRYWQPRERR
ncbi:MAG: HAMP domain-containing histidine kinase, partial [Calothrix sp. SM1_5_4]|nr:HAMP domain-containing histidine kinase [Calothrix sp. SM1_5_4]